MLNIVIVNLLMIIILFSGLGLTVIGLPGNLVILIAAISYGFFDNFNNYNISFLIVVLLAYVVGEVVEFLAGAISAKKHNVTIITYITAIVGALVGTLVGTSLLPVIGSLAGALMGAFALVFTVEYWQTKDKARALRVAKSVMAGQITGLAVKVVIALGIIIGCIWNFKWVLA